MSGAKIQIIRNDMMVCDKILRIFPLLSNKKSAPICHAFLHAIQRDILTDHGYTVLCVRIP